MAVVITAERARALVEALLAAKQRAQPGLPDLTVLDVEEHALGWLVYWQSAEYVRTRELGSMLVGHGPYLVDGQDGGVHHIPVTTFVSADWEEMYRRQIQGVEPPDPVLDAVREIVRRDGTMAALRHLRACAPRLALREAKAYVDAVRDGGEPPADLIARTRDPARHVPFPIGTERPPGADE